ncbi:hypothetical protein F1559_002844 [Cyanidiococcus yangmingshanensis]|uniref:ABC transporter domain-containing protein n=1 Tax=Cyanidiococcus yangmingshanensis TaxID=2690220 RepID=A0A7J7IM88_9RHOD|nr:hypothetical protein F1559_002844 [Cyanidiococcus yangmingshanensis]
MRRQLRRRLPLVFVQHASGYGNAWMAYAAAALAFVRSKTSTLGPEAPEQRVQWTAQLIAELMQLLGSLSGLLQFTVDLRHHALHANRLLSLWRLLQSYPPANVDQSLSTGKEYSDTTDLLWLENVRVRVPGSNQILLQDLSIRVSVGEHTLIEGPSGAGKSALMRALRGIWSLEASTSTKRSRLLLPTNALFLPTEPHLPVRSGAFRLSECLRYGCCGNLSDCSAVEHALEDDTIRMGDTIRRVGLSSKVNGAGGVHAFARWGQVLSRAEQQRLSIARALYLRPALVIMDESLRGFVETAATTLLKACMDDAITVLYMRPPERSWFDLFPHRYGIDSKGRLRRTC